MLGVLGASHVVTVEHPETGSPNRFSCDLGGELPERTEAPGYSLESRTDLHDESAFRRLADRPARTLRNRERLARRHVPRR